MGISEFHNLKSEPSIYSSGVNGKGGCGVFSRDSELKTESTTELHESKIVETEASNVVLVNVKVVTVELRWLKNWEEFE